jgi:hypothetical protein
MRVFKGIEVALRVPARYTKQLVYLRSALLQLVVKRRGKYLVGILPFPLPVGLPTNSDHQHEESYPP